MQQSLKAERTGPAQTQQDRHWWRRQVERDFFDLPRVQRVLLSQMPLAISTLIVVGFLILVDPVLLGNELLVLGAAGVLILTGVAAMLPWRFLPQWCILVIPFADFVPIGFMVHGANTTLAGVGLLSVFPVLWLAWSDLRPVFTRITAFVGPLIIGWAPILFAGEEPTKAGLIKPLLIPVIMLSLAVAATVVTESLRVQAGRLEATNEMTQRRAAQLDTIINTAEVGVVVVDEHGNDVLMNTRQRAIHRLATPTTNADPMEADLLVFEADRTSLSRPARRPVRRASVGEEFSGELYWLGEGARQRAMAVSAHQIIDAAGNRQGAVVVFHDVTAVLEAVAAQEEFVASVSHELRTPLTSILGYLDLVMDDIEDEVAARRLAVVSRNAERLLSLVNDLLGSARDAMTVTRGPGDLHVLLTRAVDAARPFARDRTIDLRLAAAPGLQGNFDAVRLAQAVDNLISNAVKFSHAGGVVEVSASQSDHGLLISVRDHGSGMSPEEQGNLFTRFYRTESARKAAIPGAGLGLAITQSIVDAHQGRLTVHSVLGQGSEFKLWIPLLPLNELNN